MIRTIISLDEDAKTWLDNKAREQGQTMTNIVREALAEYRIRHTPDPAATRSQLLESTQGIWDKGDGLAWQQQLREEWVRP